MHGETLWQHSQACSDLLSCPAPVQHSLLRVGVSLGCGWLPAHVQMERAAAAPPAERGMEAGPGEGPTATPGAGPAALRLDDCHAALLKIASDAQNAQRRSAT